MAPSYIGKLKKSVFSTSTPDAEGSHTSTRDRLSTILLWAGVALTPLAVVLLIVSLDGGLPRLAIALIALSVISTATSATLRRDSGGVRAEVRLCLSTELEQLREDVREDIRTATKATHAAILREVHAVRSEVESLRGQRPPASPTAVASAAVPPPSAGVVQHTETVQVTTRQMTLTADHAHGQAPPYSRPEPHEGAYPRQTPSHAPETTGGLPGREYAPRQAIEADPLPAATVLRPATRPVSPPPPPPQYGQRMPSGPAAPYASEPTTQYSRRRDRRAEAEQVPSFTESLRPAQPRGEDPWVDLRSADAADESWVQMRSGRQGGELRMGERRTELRSDENGHELRATSRWAAIRQEADEEFESPRRRTAAPDWGSAERDGRDYEAPRGRVGRDRGGRGERGGYGERESRPVADDRDAPDGRVGRASRRAAESSWRDSAHEDPEPTESGWVAPQYEDSGYRPRYVSNPSGERSGRRRRREDDDDYRGWQR